MNQILIILSKLLENNIKVGEIENIKIVEI